MLVVPLPGLAVSIPRALRAPFPTPFLALLDPFLPSLDTGVRGDLARLFGDVVVIEIEASSRDAVRLGERVQLAEV